MPRLIDVPSDLAGDARLVVQVGDVLVFSASGGRVVDGRSVVERLGPFLTAVVGMDGRVLAPEGPPSTVLFVANAPGRAALDVMSGDPWRGTVTTSYAVDVEAPAPPVPTPA